MLDRISQPCLFFGAAGCFAGAVLHIAVLIAGPDWIEFVGAPPHIVQSAREGTWLAPVTALGITALLFLWSAYGLSAAGKIRKLPFLKTAIGLIALIFIGRGALIFVLFDRINWSHGPEAFFGTASILIFILGLCYVSGCATLLRASRQAQN